MPVNFLFYLAILIFIWGLWQLLAGGYTVSAQDKIRRDPFTSDFSPEFVEFDDHPIFNSFAVGGMWTISLIIFLVINPTEVATILNTVLGPLHLTWILSDLKIVGISTLILNTLFAYLVRVKIGRQFKGSGVDLPKEMIESWEAKEKE